ncbi:hypothetical protein, partial [Enterobacter intestinihominis]
PVGPVSAAPPGVFSGGGYALTHQKCFPETTQQQKKPQKKKANKRLKKTASSARPHPGHYIPHPPHDMYNINI